VTFWIKNFKGSISSNPSYNQGSNSLGLARLPTIIIYKEVFVSAAAACNTHDEAAANKVKCVFDFTEPIPIAIYH
jgi:hypothetical protein